MDKQSLSHQLTDEERADFEAQGYLIIRNALPKDMVSRAKAALDRVEAKHRKQHGLTPDEHMNHLDAIGEDDVLLELLDWPTTFPKVWGALGPYIQLYHSHYIVTPPLPEGREKKRLGWHQDSGRLNNDIESDPRPRISVKIGFFLTDASKPGRGNFHVLPGSHLSNTLPTESSEAISVLVSAGDAVMFDRRVWHAGSQNFSEITRKVLFFGYSYRWLKPRDDMTVEHYMERSDPIRRQLLGASPTGGFGFTSPADEDIPLKQWLERQGILPGA